MSGGLPGPRRGRSVTDGGELITTPRCSSNAISLRKDVPVLHDLVVDDTEDVGKWAIR